MYESFDGVEKVIQAIIQCILLIFYISDKRVTVYNSEICAVEDVCGDTIGKDIVVTSIGKNLVSYIFISINIFTRKTTLIFEQFH